MDRLQCTSNLTQNSNSFLIVLIYDQIRLECGLCSCSFIRKCGYIFTVYD